MAYCGAKISYAVYLVMAEETLCAPLYVFCVMSEYVHDATRADLKVKPLSEPDRKHDTDSSITSFSC